MSNASLSDNWTPISKPEHSDPSEKTHFCALSLRSHSHSFDHYPERMTIEQSRDVDQPVYQHLCFYAHLSLHHNGGLQCPNHCSRCTNPSIPYFPLLSLWTSPGFLNSSTKTHLWPRMGTPATTFPAETIASDLELLIQCFTFSSKPLQCELDHTSLWHKQNQMPPLSLFDPIVGHGGAVYKNYEQNLWEGATQLPLGVSPTYCWQCRPSSHCGFTGTEASKQWIPHVLECLLLIHKTLVEYAWIFLRG